MKKRRTRSNISETHFSSDLIAIKGILSLYFSCLHFLYLTVGFTTMEGTLFLCIILLFFHLVKFCLVAEEFSFAYKIEWENLSIYIFLFEFQLSSIGWSPVGGCRENREEKRGFFIYLFFGFLKFFLQRLIFAFHLYIFYLLHYI